jgi:hypothetical protein
MSDSAVGAKSGLFLLGLRAWLAQRTDLAAILGMENERPRTGP